ncbi:MAG: gliding motility-associated ABC transporter ATP-binding subunit GldA [Bacteroidia bacterium]
MSIEVKNIIKMYGEQRALNDVTFNVSASEVVGFLGPNGAGKSTMMKILTCFIPQTTGTATVCGFDVQEESLAVRKNVGYLPENNPLYAEMYIKEYLEFIAGLHGLKNTKQRINEMIEITGLQKEKNKKIGALSKGYKQRVGLAQAMIHDPKVLILDEPTTGLDPNQLVEIRKLIIEIGKQKTVLLSTHIMQEVEAICNRVIIINDGEIVANETTAVLQNSQSQNVQLITVEFDKATSFNALKSLPHFYNAANIKDNVWQIEAHTNEDIRGAIFQYAVNNGLAVLTLHKEDKRLEDVFKQLTKK